jgi:uncharacterized membrane protein
MSELILAVYDCEDTAEHVLGVLRAQRDELLADLSSAALIRIGADGSMTITTTDHPGSRSSFWGVLWEALFGLVFLVPAPGTSYGANLGGLLGAIERSGVNADFRAVVRDALERGSSGLALVAIDWDATLLLDHLYVRPHALLRATLSLERDAQLVQELGGFPAPDARPRLGRGNQ